MRFAYGWRIVLLRSLRVKRIWCEREIGVH
jgi:hypothetical protein